MLELRKKARIIGVIGGVIAILPGVGLLLLALYGLLPVITGERSFSDYGLGGLPILVFLLLGVLLFVVGSIGLTGGLLAPTHPLIAVLLQAIAAFLPTSAIFLSALSEPRNFPALIWLFWPAFFWGGMYLAWKSLEN